MGVSRMSKASKALEDFQKQYPMTTSGDLQAFVLGYQAATKDAAETVKEKFETFKEKFETLLKE